MGINDIAWDGGFKQLIGDESLGRTMGIVPDDTTKQFHFIGIQDTELDLALTADSVPTWYIHGTASATDWMSFTSTTIGGTIVALSGSTSVTIAGASVTLDSTDAMTFQIGTVDLIVFDDAAITLVAATEVAGQDTYFKVEDGGAGTAAAGAAGADFYIDAGIGGAGGSDIGGTGGSLFLSAGDGGTSIGGTGGAAGDVHLTAGSATEGVGASAGGNAGRIILEPGFAGAGGTGTAGYMQVLGTSSWIANSSRIVAFGTTGPSSVGTNVKEWFTVMNAEGSVRYIASWSD